MFRGLHKQRQQPHAAAPQRSGHNMCGMCITMTNLELRENKTRRPPFWLLWATSKQRVANGRGQGTTLEPRRGKNPINYRP